MRGSKQEQAMEETTIDNVTDADLQVLTVADDDASVEAFLADVYRNEEAISEADLIAMERQAQAELAASPFHDLTPERHAELVAAFPFGRGWMPSIEYRANDARPFVAQLRRATVNGPDIANCGSYLSAECALFVAVAFANDMVITDRIGTDAEKDAIRAKITYAPR
jgi:hypothetical protein